MNVFTTVYVLTLYRLPADNVGPASLLAAPDPAVSRRRLRSVPALLAPDSAAAVRPARLFRDGGDPRLDRPRPDRFDGAERLHWSRKETEAMPYSPVELRHVRLGRSLFGYKRDATERLLDEVAASFEDVWRERGELTDQVDELSKQLEDIRGREHLLAATLVAAEKSAADSRDAAKRQAELILAEAHQEARSIMRWPRPARASLRRGAPRRGAAAWRSRDRRGVAAAARRRRIPEEEPAGARRIARRAAAAPSRPRPENGRRSAGGRAGRRGARPVAEPRGHAEFPSLMNIRTEVDPDQL